MGYRERVSHSGCVYPVQDTTHMETSREKERDTRIIEKNGMEYGRNEREHYKEECFKQDLTSVKELN